MPLREQHALRSVWSLRSSRRRQLDQNVHRIPQFRILRPWFCDHQPRLLRLGQTGDFYCPPRHLLQDASKWARLLYRSIIRRPNIQRNSGWAHLRGHRRDHGRSVRVQSTTRRIPMRNQKHQVSVNIT